MREGWTVEPSEWVLGGVKVTWQGNTAEMGAEVAERFLESVMEVPCVWVPGT